MLTYIVIAGIVMLLTINFLVFRAVFKGAWAVITKILASLAFIILGLFGAMGTGLELSVLFIVIGLVLGLVGDIVLELKFVYPSDRTAYLNTGMIAFGVGHVMYLLAFLNIIAGQSLVLPLVIGGGAAIFFTVLIMFAAKPILKLDFGKFFYQSFAYTLLLSFVSAFSIYVAVTSNLMLWWFAGGVTLIFASDLVLSTMYFGNKENSVALSVLNHLLYYAGQAAIAGTIFFCI